MDWSVYCTNEKTVKSNCGYFSPSMVLNISNKCSSVVFPATLTSGLGLLKVCGRMRVPQPAMGITILKVSAKVNSCIEVWFMYFTNEKTVNSNGGYCSPSTVLKTVIPVARSGDCPEKLYPIYYECPNIG